MHEALEEAVKALRLDTSIEEPLRENLKVDRDTEGSPGSPPIVETILRKIDGATVFVADLTFTGTRTDGRLTPNPNVMLEYGYALKSLSYGRIIGVLNAAFGAANRATLPFDLGHLEFPIQYDCPENATPAKRAQALTHLTAQLRIKLRAVFEALPTQTLGEADEFAPQPRGDAPGRFRQTREPVGMLYSGSPLDPGTSPVLLRGGPVMWLRLMPKRSIAKNLSFNALHMAFHESGRYVTALNMKEEKINSRGVRGADGYGEFFGSSAGEALAILYAFRNGETWSLYSLHLQWDEQNVHLVDLNFAEALRDQATLLRRLKVNGPYRWEAGLHGIKGRRLIANSRVNTFPSQPFLSDEVIVTGDFGGELEMAEQALCPFFARVWDEAGRQHPCSKGK